MLGKTFPGPFFNSTPLVITSRSFPGVGLAMGSFFVADSAISTVGASVILVFRVGIGVGDSFGRDGVGTDRAGGTGDRAPESIATMGVFGCLTGTVGDTTGFFMIGAGGAGGGLCVGNEATSISIFLANFTKIGLETKWSVGETVALIR